MSEADDQINAAEEGIKNFKIDEETKNDNKTESDHVLNKDIEYQATTQSTTAKLNTGDNRFIKTEKTNSQAKNDSSDERKSVKVKLEYTSKRRLQKNIAPKNEQSSSRIEKTFETEDFLTNLQLLGTGVSSEQTSSQSSGEIKIQIATWNALRLGLKKAEENKKFNNVLQELITKHKIGIIAIQEICSKEAEETLTTIVEKLNKHFHTTHKWKYKLSADTGKLANGQEKNAFLWDSTSIEFQEAKLCSDELYDRTPGMDWTTYYRKPFWGKFKISGHEINIISVHIYYGDSPSRRREEVKSLPTTAAKISSNGKNMIILGDFNLEPDDKGFDQMRQQKYKNALNGSQKTNVVNGGTKCYDNIWLKSTSNYPKLQHSGVFREGFDDNPPSDHFPVWAEILIKNKRNRESM